jgi:hypothetical protein
MKFTTTISITFNDLSFDKREEIRNDLAESIRESKELMDQIREEEMEQRMDMLPDLKKRLPLDHCIDMRVDELVMDNENQFREYLKLEFEIEL